MQRREEKLIQIMVAKVVKCLSLENNDDSLGNIVVTRKHRQLPLPK